MINNLCDTAHVWSIIFIYFQYTYKLISVFSGSCYKSFEGQETSFRCLQTLPGIHIFRNTFPPFRLIRN